jgi:hypothetical protein
MMEQRELILGALKRDDHHREPPSSSSLSTKTFPVLWRTA